MVGYDHTYYHTVYDPSRQEVFAKKSRQKRWMSTKVETTIGDNPKIPWKWWGFETNAFFQCSKNSFLHDTFLHTHDKPKAMLQNQETCFKCLSMFAIMPIWKENADELFRHSRGPWPWTDGKKKHPLLSDAATPTGVASLWNLRKYRDSCTSCLCLRFMNGPRILPIEKFLAEIHGFRNGSHLKIDPSKGKGLSTNHHFSGAKLLLVSGSVSFKGLNIYQDELSYTIFTACCVITARETKKHPNATLMGMGVATKRIRKRPPIHHPENHWNKTLLWTALESINVHYCSHATWARLTIEFQSTRNQHLIHLHPTAYHHLINN